MKLPQAFIEKYQRLLGAEAPAFFASFDQPAVSAFRLNPLKDDFKNVDLPLNDPVPYCDWGYYGTVDGHTLDHQAGYVYSQEPSAMYVGEVAHPQPGERVLDLCAAPGGKTTHLGSFMQNQGVLVTNEINKQRAQVLSENVERWGLQNTVVVNASPDELEKKWPQTFDRILVDAPCSGEGMFRKDPTAMQYWNPDYPAECARRQKKILASAYQMLKPNSELIYSTCTFSPEEDEQVIAWLLDTYSDLEMVPIEKYAGMIAAKPEWANGNPDLTQAVRLFPHLMRGEGHFIAKLRRRSETAAPKKEKLQKKASLSSEQKKDWQTFAEQTLATDALTQPYLSKDRLYQTPAGTPVLSGLHVLRPGLFLGTFKKHRFEPSYALALALRPTQFKQVLNLDEDQYTHYVHGETITVPQAGKGWLALSARHKIFSMGKQVQTTVKNAFPKGLRH
ncbi:NOL1 NOP2 sun family protein [Lactobacillus selangorensis]|uniref:NOL1 NOP2 sun family protein n=1 Tax=Lactobacillus selangorensis TaxID=81857 RepID=A0A0R2FZL1_9LACO|nr:RsmF rRNA methyltransferase first C-terminal domain-containing protein [Lactobacillus selangorensis]KRN29501.1 NOL1 NOP2 sun family protein [Lactobacillus selangorensis]KRN33969.1 NOL1 NOP2 sun family protein [Lactobacillus selangorensis]